MQAEIRRIDLTTDPATVEAWPSLDWLAAPTAYAGPRGRSGLWDAMANAVQRAREASTGSDLDADVVALGVEAPHLAYLARVAASSAADEHDGPDADVIALDELRPRDPR